MRDTFLLLWVGFLIIGVVGSIVSSIRKQIQAATPPAQRPIPSRWQPPPQPSTPSAARPQQPVRRVVVSGRVPAGQMPQWLQQATAEIAAQAPRPAPQAIPPKAPLPARPPVASASPPPVDFPSPQAASAGASRLFRNRNTIVQAVIAAEVLGKPRAFNDEYFGA